METETSGLEQRIALIHRVIVPDRDYPKEYAILVTDKQSIFILQEKTRRGFVLRGEMRYGTALVTDVEPKTLGSYEQDTLLSLAGNPENIAVPHDMVNSLVLSRDEPKFRLRDLPVWLTMKMQKQVYRVYNFEVRYRNKEGSLDTLRCYLVPLGVYFKPRRMVQSREDILRDYAMEALQLFQRVLPAGTVKSTVV